MPLHLSDGTEKIKQRALELSREWRHHYLGVEHIFAAACALDPACAGALGRWGLTLADLEAALLEWIPRGDETPLWEGTPETPRLRRLFKAQAGQEAEACRAVRIEPIHLLSAALREGGSVPARVLAARGLELEAARRALLQGGGGGGAPGRVVPSPGGERAGGPAPKKESFLERYGKDLVGLAREGKVEPVVGRQDEIRRVLQVLTRKTKSNPVLTGEAGVGKTSVVYGLALRIAQGAVPDALKGRRLVELNLTSMVAGARHRGEFEERIQGVVEELVADPSVIAFIDEIHQIVGAGDSRGGMDAGNILKPALARGDFALMGATTTDEYRRSIEADPALERRFQPVLVGEPSEEEALEILKGLRPRYEQHHGASFSDEALLAAVKLSVRFLPDRNLPDKAIDLIDEAAARIKTRSGVFEQGARFEVTPEGIAEVVADWTGVPVSRLDQEEERRLLEMERLLQGRVVGQDHALNAVARTIRVVRLGLASPNRPGGVFMFLGPSGVGKTELGKAVAEFLFGSEREMVRFDMSEFHDRHSVARLIGAPPGYVGYEGEGQLTRAVRTKPFCVILLDEVEKAHPDVFDLFLQVFDDGRLTDNKGRTVNFTNTILILTSNLGSREMASRGPSAPPPPASSPRSGPEALVGPLDTLPPTYQAALRSHFRPEFLNRIDELVVFRSLGRGELRGIVELNLQRLIRRFQDQRQLHLVLDEGAVDLLLEHGYHPEFGARPLQRAIDAWLTRPLAEELLRDHPPPGSTVLVSRQGERLTFTASPGAARPTSPSPPAPPSPPEPRSPAPDPGDPWSGPSGLPGGAGPSWRGGGSPWEGGDPDRTWSGEGPS